MKVTQPPAEQMHNLKRGKPKLRKTLYTGKHTHK